MSLTTLTSIRARRRRDPLARLILTVVAMLALLTASACGSDSLSNDTSPSGSAQGPSVASDDTLAAKLPEKIKAAGKIVIGVDASYPPNETLDKDGKTVVGFDVDLFNAVAAKFGVTTQWQPAKFDSIIPGISSGKYDIGVSSFTINNERMQQVTMISYFNAGTQWLTQNGNPKQVTIDNPCGLTVAVQADTVQHTEDLPERQKQCGSNPIKILPFDDQTQATAAVASGRADATLADSPVAAYAAKQSGGKLELVGEIYDAAPYGYTLSPDQADFAAAIVEALNQLKADGSYDKILTTWGVEAGGISDFAVNPKQ